MDKETLSNYGWIVICVLVLSVMIALATPFGDYVADGFKAAYKGFGDTNTEVTDMMYSAVGAKAPASCGIEGHYKGDNRGEHGIPATDCTKGHRYTCECVSWIVPEGGTYTMATAVNGKSVYNAGEALPIHYTPIGNDIYENEDYKYRCFPSDSTWTVAVKNRDKTLYGAILSEIAGKPITDMFYTFGNCKYLVESPTIPDSVTSMYRTFENCTSLKVAPKLPSNVTQLGVAFDGCKSLTTAPEIPSKVTNMNCTFRGCPITTAPAIPSSVTNMNSTFSGCPITTAPAIPSGVTDMTYTFNYCELLKGQTITIPSSVTSPSGTSGTWDSGPSWTKQ